MCISRSREALHYNHLAKFVVTGQSSCFAYRGCDCTPRLTNTLARQAYDILALCLLLPTPCRVDDPDRDAREQRHGAQNRCHRPHPSQRKCAACLQHRPAGTREAHKRQRNVSTSDFLTKGSTRRQCKRLSSRRSGSASNNCKGSRKQRWSRRPIASSELAVAIST